jgi:hypothetical protein
MLHGVAAEGDIVVLVEARGEQVAEGVILLIEDEEGAVGST